MNTSGYMNDMPWVVGLHRMGGDLSSSPALRECARHAHASPASDYAVRCVVLLVCTTTYVHTSQSHEGEWLVPLFLSIYLHTYIM